MVVIRKIVKWLIVIRVQYFQKGIGSLKAWISTIFLFLVIILLNTSVLNTELKAKVVDAGFGSRKEIPKRGDILDRDGRALAASRLSRNVIAVKRPDTLDMYRIIAKFMAPRVNLTEDEIVEAYNNTKYNVKLVEGMTQQEFDEFCEFRYLNFSRELDNFYNSNPGLFNGFKDKSEFYKKFDREFGEIQARKDYDRCYPGGEMSAHIIGYSSDVQGIFTPWRGLERKYNDTLKGGEGRVIEWKNARGEKLPGFDTIRKGIVPGYDLRLTLSSEIQSLAYKALEERVKSTGAKGGCVIVLDAPSAEILALANYPTFDPENYNDYLNLGPEHPDTLPPNEYRLNPMHNLVTQLSFEPGSVLKPIVASWALEDEIINPDERFEINPKGIKVKGKDNPITDTHPPEKTEYWCIDKINIHSSNVGMAQVGMKMGREKLIESLERFHLGEKVLGLEEEYAGVLNKSLEETIIGTPSWSLVREATVAFGQGITATPIQIVAAMNVFANDGCYVKPRIALDASSPVSETHYFPQPERERILSQETLSMMQDILESAVNEGTGTYARCNGYRVAGKTGTAEKPDRVTHGYYKNRHYACFVGFGPLPEPKYTILVLLDEPKPHWGGASCGPVFRVIFENLMVWDGIPPINEKNTDEEL